jgi:hypothetical protein
MRRTVGVPAETTLDMVSLHRPVTRNDVLDGGCQQVTVVRGTGSEGRAIVEGVGLLLRRQFELPLESIDFLDLGVSHGGSSVRAGRRWTHSPLGEDALLLLGKVDRHDCKYFLVVWPERWCNGIQLFWRRRLIAAESQTEGGMEIWGKSWLNFPPSHSLLPSY